jgi:hypothetical protein
MLAFVGLIAGLLVSSAPPAQNEGVRGLAVQYADGRRTVTQILSSGRSSWTATFPRIDGVSTDRDGLPLKALEFQETLEDSGIAVTLALLYGSPHQTRVPVTTVHVTTAPVRVEALEAFGVRPIVLALVSLPPAQLPIPSVTSPSSSLEISMETIGGPRPAYHATIVNHSAHAVMMLAFTSYRGKAPGTTGTPRGAGHTPLIPPGGTYVLTIGATPVQGRDAGSGWLAVDRIAITSVLWSDGLIDGDAEPAAAEHALDAGTAQQIDRILVLLRQAAADPRGRPPQVLKDAIGGLTVSVTPEEAGAVARAIPGSVTLPASRLESSMRSGMQNAKIVVLRELEDFVRVPDAAAAEYLAWLARTTEKYDGWRRRIRGSRPS